MAKFDSEGFIIHKGTITIVPHFVSNGYEFLRVIVRGKSREYTQKAANKLNEHFSDVDYTQFVGTIEPLFYDRDIVVDFQVYDKENRQYCAPIFNVRTTKLPLDLLKAVDKIQASNPEDFICQLIANGFTLLKSKVRSTKEDNGSTQATCQIKDTFSERSLMGLRGLMYH